MVGKNRKNLGREHVEQGSQRSCRKTQNREIRCVLFHDLGQLNIEVPYTSERLAKLAMESGVHLEHPLHNFADVPNVIIQPVKIVDIKCFWRAKVNCDERWPSIIIRYIIT